MATAQPTLSLAARGLIAMDVSYDANGETSVVAVVGPDGSGYRELTKIAGGRSADQALSRSGGAVIFFDRATSDGAESHIFSIGLEGGPAKQLTFGRVHDNDPALSPDGRSVAFDRSAGGASPGPASLEILDLSTGEIVAVTTPPAASPGGDQYPDWAPDGHRIAYERDGSIFIVDVARRSTVTVLSPSQPGHRPRWSPDGTLILFGTTNIETGPHQIQVVEPTGQGYRTLTTPDEYAVHPCWSPDGGLIAYIARNPAAQDLELRIMTAAGESPTVAWHSEPATDVFPGHPSWGR